MTVTPLLEKQASAPTAHSKGIIALDENTDSGFYLQHSMV